MKKRIANRYSKRAQAKNKIKGVATFSHGQHNLTTHVCRTGGGFVV